MGDTRAQPSIDRLFDAPELAGPTIAGLKISPDGSRVVDVFTSTTQPPQVSLHLPDCKHAYAMIKRYFDENLQHRPH